jgi:hypothetical protein
MMRKSAPARSRLDAAAAIRAFASTHLPALWSGAISLKSNE